MLPVDDINGCQGCGKPDKSRWLVPSFQYEHGLGAACWLCRIRLRVPMWVVKYIIDALSPYGRQWRYHSQNTTDQH